MNAFTQSFEHSNLFPNIISANGNAKSIHSLFLGKYKVMFGGSLSEFHCWNKWVIFFYNRVVGKVSNLYQLILSLFKNSDFRLSA